MNKVSIIVPIYNMGSKLEICVKSLIMQTYKNIEIILVNDGSTDDSASICERVKEKDSRIQVFHTINMGSGPARNYGISRASGVYVYFPDADDYIEPNTIEILEKIMREGNHDLVVFGFKSVLKNDKVKKIKRYPDIIKYGDEVRNDYADYMTISSEYGIQGAPWNKFFNMKLIKQHNIKYPNLRRHQDEGFIARYMTYANSIHFIPDVLYTYYTNDLSSEWDKYPIDYIEAVKGLYAERNKNILTWNPNNKTVKELVYREFICGVIKSLELSFSPKFRLDKKNRIEWIKDTVNSSQLLENELPICLGLYQKIIYKLIKGKYFKLAYILMYFKVEVQKNGLLKYIHK
ncbi:glycosyltransferase [Clostridium sp. D53t1_180928_C8]|uniref:glycosyltransferase family 2 protein n=1 Tax=Clostridium sp. D53t1_180928_C8 TaxID=2787101 RepID=UPI0018AB3AE9|nr:glycosyltransferase [Clostridium sp. D53t1_180928_C8]